MATFLEEIIAFIIENAKAFALAGVAWYAMRFIMGFGVKCDIKAGRTDEETIKQSYGRVNVLGIGVLLFLLAVANGYVG